MKARDILQQIGKRTKDRKAIYSTALSMPYLGTRESRLKAISNCVRLEFPFLIANSDELQERDVEQFDGLFVWLADEIRQYERTPGGSDLALVKILALAALLDFGEVPWLELAQAVPTVPQFLLVDIAQFLKTERIKGPAILDSLFGASGSSIISKEIQSKSWDRLAHMIDHLWGRLAYSAKVQAINALYVYGQGHLLSVIDVESDFLEIVACILHVEPERYIDVAVKTNNRVFKFWATQRSVSMAERGGNSYPQHWERLLSDATTVPDEWRLWLATLNRTPSNFPKLQAVLGQVLSRSSPAAREIYVESISLDSDLNRVAVATVFSVLRENLSLPDRQLVWAKAFGIWHRWNFGLEMSTSNANRVMSSALDFAVVGYMVECLDTEQRAQKMSELRERVRSIDRDWHTDKLTVISKRFRIISLYQIYAHAEAVITDDVDWLRVQALYRPDWEDGSDYRHFKYEAPMHIRATFPNVEIGAGAT